MKGLKTLRNYNKKGNAALVALLIVIIIVGIGASVMILAGRNTIDETGKFSANSSKAADPASTSAVTSQTAPETTKKPDLYPQQDASFKQTNIKDFSAAASILVDLDSDKIIAGSNMDQKIYPASLTKVMTILVAAENLRSYDDTYTFKDADFTKLIEQNASMAGFKAGEKVTARDLLYGAILPSGADAVVGLENLVAGSEAAFVKMMNDRAKELGLKNTNFVNGSGIHDPNHYSTVRDIAVIMKVANHNITCRNVMNTSEYTTAKTTQNPQGIKLACLLSARLQGFFIDKNGNGANDDKARVLGGKTGFTDEAGSTIATICEDKETEHLYVCVLAKCKSTEQSVSETMAMYEKYLPGSKANVPDAVTAATTTTAAGAAPATTAAGQATTTTKKAA